MSFYFLDSSALVKRYVSEIGSAWVESLFAPLAGNTILIASITRVEIIAAITRRARSGATSMAEAAYARTLFMDDIETDCQMVPVSEAVLMRAMALAESFALRGYDAVQLAVALEVNAQLSSPAVLMLASADAELNAAAQASGLTVENPNTHL